MSDTDRYNRTPFPIALAGDTKYLYIYFRAFLPNKPNRNRL